MQCALNPLGPLSAFPAFALTARQHSGQGGRRAEAGNGSGPLLLVPVWQTHHRGETTNFGRRARRQIPTQTSSTDLLNSEDS